MNKCEQLLDDAATAHDKSLADERDRRIALVREAFSRIFPDWPDDCVEVDDKGVMLDGGIRLELRLNLTAATSYSYFTYSHRTERCNRYTWETVVVASLADLGFAVMLRREQMEENKREAEEAWVNTIYERGALEARNAALDAYEKKNWLGRLLSKHPGHGVER